jgi:hypothetical protein
VPGDRNLLDSAALDDFAFGLPVHVAPPAPTPRRDPDVAEAVERCYGLLRASGRPVAVARAAVTGFLAARWGSLESVVLRSDEVAPVLDEAETVFSAGGEG